jgi:hypothetical protein
MTKQWAHRHEKQHKAYLNGRPTKLQPQQTRRLASEFEAAVRARGAAAKAAAAKR